MQALGHDKQDSIATAFIKCPFENQTMLMKVAKTTMAAKIKVFTVLSYSFVKQAQDSTVLVNCLPHKDEGIR